MLTASRRSGKFLTFTLGAEEFGVEILKVQEIVGAMRSTRIPGMPAFASGIVNLRGRVIPVLHMRRKFGMDEDAHGDSCIIVVHADDAPVGIVVDRVSEVISIKADDVEDVPSFGAVVDTHFLLGVAKSEGKVRLLLDIDRVVAHGSHGGDAVIDERHAVGRAA